MKLNRLSTSVLSLMSRTNELNDFTYSFTMPVPICLSIFRDSSHPCHFHGKELIFSSFFRVSNISIFSQPTTASSLYLARHQSFTSPDKYMAVYSYLFTNRYASSNEIIFHVSREVLQVLGVPCTPERLRNRHSHLHKRSILGIGHALHHSRFNSMISPSRDLVHSWNSSVIISTFSRSVSIHSS